MQRRNGKRYNLVSLFVKLPVLGESTSGGQHTHLHPAAAPSPGYRTLSAPPSTPTTPKEASSVDCMEEYHAIYRKIYMNLYFPRFFIVFLLEDIYTKYT